MNKSIHNTYKNKTIVNLSRCSDYSIKNLPSDIKIKGSLHIKGNQSSAMISDMKVTEDISLVDSKLVIGENLVIGRSLGLTGCSKIWDIPPDLKIRGKIYVDEETYFGLDYYQAVYGILYQLEDQEPAERMKGLDPEEIATDELWDKIEWDGEDYDSWPRHRDYYYED